MKAIQYCKAYYLRGIKQFDHWTELREPGSENLPDDAIVYLRDDLHLVHNPASPDEEYLLRSVTPEWQQFCQQVLQFSVPEEASMHFHGSSS